MDLQETFQRLDAFLQKVTGRLEEIIKESEAGFRQLLAQNLDEPTPYMNAFTALEARVDSLRETLENTYEEQIEEKLEELDEESNEKTGGHGTPCTDDGLARKARAEQYLEQRWRRFRAFWEAEFFRHAWPRVQAAMSEPVNCNQCGGPVQPTVRHQSESLNCGHCGAVKQIIPSQLEQTYYGIAPHAFAEEKTLEQRLAIEQFQEQIHQDQQARDLWEPPVEAMEQLVAMERKYWEDYVALKHAVLPMAPDIQQRLIADRMRLFGECNLAQHRGWQKKYGG